MLRIGHGYDTHRFESGKKLILAGVHVPFSKGMQAHSDGDVIIHAVCDALLGAASLGDLGRHFPDTDAKFANFNSRLFLRDVHAKLSHKNYLINNVDITVLAEQPRLAGFIPQMCANLAEDMRIEIDQVNIKATTTERQGFVGREEGIVCYAVALLSSESKN